MGAGMGTGTGAAITIPIKGLFRRRHRCMMDNTEGVGNGILIVVQTGGGIYWLSENTI